MDDPNAPGPAKAGYFRVSLAVAVALVDANPSADLLAAWLVLRRHAFGPKRQWTAAGAKRIAGVLGITRPRATGLLRDLLALRYGKRGESSFILPATQWNADHEDKAPISRKNACVYVMPEPDGPAAYLPDALMPPGETRSRLADLCDALDPDTALDALRMLLLVSSVTSCGDYLGADPAAFAYVKWQIDGHRTVGNYEFELGHFGTSRGRYYWLATPNDTDFAVWSAIESVTGGRTETHTARFWAAHRLLTKTGMLYRVAIASDARGRLLYPLWVYGASHRDTLAAIGIPGDLALAFHRQARREGLDCADDLRMAAVDMEGDATGVYVCATATPHAPIIRTVFVPALIAPTPQNMDGLRTLAMRGQQWT